MPPIVLLVLSKKRTWVAIFAIVAAIAGQFSKEAEQDVKATSKEVIEAVFEDEARGTGER